MGGASQLTRETRYFIGPTFRILVITNFAFQRPFLRASPTVFQRSQRVRCASKNTPDGLPTGVPSNPPYPPRAWRPPGVGGPGLLECSGYASFGTALSIVTSRCRSFEGGPYSSTRIFSMSSNRCIARSSAALPTPLLAGIFAIAVGA
jgi:hypothetical protein